MLMHSNRVIIFLVSQKRAQYTFCMQEDVMWNKDEGKRITWNGSVVVHGAGGSRWHCYRGNWLWWQTLILLLLSYALLYYLLPLFFLFQLSIVFLPLCSGFVEVLLVLAVLLVVGKRKIGDGLWRTLLRFLCIFFFHLLLSACASFCFICSLSLSPFSFSLRFFLFPISSVPLSVFFFFSLCFFFSSSSSFLASVLRFKTSPLSCVRSLLWLL